MRVVAELSQPVGGRFLNENNRVGLRFGFNNTVLRHIFEEISPDVAARVAAIFPEESKVLGRSFVATAPPADVAALQPFDVDPNAVDRALRAHHDTVQALASWVRSIGWEPRLPRPDEPQYDLAWESKDAVYVAEVKSTTTETREMQLRLGLGQVLRYRQQLSRRGKKVVAWLVAESAVPDASWATACADVGVRLTWPTAFR